MAGPIKEEVFAQYGWVHTRDGWTLAAHDLPDIDKLAVGDEFPFQGNTYAVKRINGVFYFLYGYCRNSVTIEGEPRLPRRPDRPLILTGEST